MTGVPLLLRIEIALPVDPPPVPVYVLPENRAAILEIAGGYPALDAARIQAHLVVSHKIFVTQNMIRWALSTDR